MSKLIFIKHNLLLEKADFFKVYRRWDAELIYNEIVDETDDESDDEWDECDVNIGDC
jgi:hypothetical protein